VTTNSVGKIETGEPILFSLSKERPTIYLDRTGREGIEKLGKNQMHEGTFIGMVEDEKAGINLLLIADENGVVHHIPAENVKLGDDIYDIAETTLPRPQKDKPSCAANTTFACLLHLESIGRVDLSSWRESPDGLNTLFQHVLHEVSFDFLHKKFLMGGSGVHQSNNQEKLLREFGAKYILTHNAIGVTNQLERGNPAILNLKVFGDQDSRVVARSVEDGKIVRRTRLEPTNQTIDGNANPTYSVHSDAFKERFLETPVPHRLGLIRDTLREQSNSITGSFTGYHAVLAIGIVKHGPKKGYYIIIDSNKGTFDLYPPEQIENSLNSAFILLPKRPPPTRIPNDNY
jgi:hypothetical protein